MGLLSTKIAEPCSRFAVMSLWMVRFSWAPLNVARREAGGVRGAPAGRPRRLGRSPTLRRTAILASARRIWFERIFERRIAPRVRRGIRPGPYRCSSHSFIPPHSRRWFITIGRTLQIDILRDENPRLARRDKHPIAGLQRQLVVALLAQFDVQSPLESVGGQGDLGDRAGRVDAFARWRPSPARRCDASAMSSSCGRK